MVPLSYLLNLSNSFILIFFCFSGYFFKLQASFGLNNVYHVSEIIIKKLSFIIMVFVSHQ